MSPQRPLLHDRPESLAFHEGSEPSNESVEAGAVKPVAVDASKLPDKGEYGDVGDADRVGDQETLRRVARAEKAKAAVKAVP